MSINSKKANYFQFMEWRKGMVQKGVIKTKKKPNLKPMKSL
tara:strand:+ start:721 stop:843 length:123 start_codon:yes stop_codon:yes gene_type:complete